MNMVRLAVLFLTPVFVASVVEEARHVPKELINHTRVSVRSTKKDRNQIRIGARKEPNINQPYPFEPEMQAKKEVNVTLEEELPLGEFVNGDGSSAPPKPHINKPHRWSLATEETLMRMPIVLLLAIGGLCWAAPAQAQMSSRSNPHYFIMQGFFLVSWFFLSAALTVFNKWVFIKSGGDFPYVSILLWLHMFCASVLTRVFRYLRRDFFPAVEINGHGNLNILKLVLPVSLLQSLALVLGSTAYLYLSVSYIQMTKAAMPAMVFITSCILRIETFSMKDAVFLLMIGSGVVGCMNGELLFNWTGFAYQMAAFVCEAFLLIMLKLMLSRSSSMPLDPLSALYYLAPMNMLALTLPMLYEAQNVTFEQMFELRYVLLDSCLMAFAFTVASVCFISLVSAVQFAVIGLLKDFALIIGSTLIFGNMLTREEILAAVVVMGAAVAFQQYRQDKETKTIELEVDYSEITALKAA